MAICEGSGKPTRTDDSCDRCARKFAAWRGDVREAVAIEHESEPYSTGDEVTHGDRPDEVTHV